MKLSKNEIAKMFLKFSSQGYASGAKPNVMPTLIDLSMSPKLKAYRFEEGKWSYLDVYASGEKERSWGFTMLFFDGQQVLWTTYGGRVITENCEKADISPKAVTTFLKRALLEQYQMWEDGLDTFRAGRGPQNFTDEALYLEYINYVYRFGSDGISAFGNHETIVNINNLTPVFWHRCLGGLLVEAE